MYDLKGLKALLYVVYIKKKSMKAHNTEHNTIQLSTWKGQVIKPNAIRFMTVGDPRSELFSII